MSTATPITSTPTTDYSVVLLQIAHYASLAADNAAYDLPLDFVLNSFEKQTAEDTTTSDGHHRHRNSAGSVGTFEVELLSGLIQARRHAQTGNWTAASEAIKAVSVALPEPALIALTHRIDRREGDKETMRRAIVLCCVHVQRAVLRQTERLRKPLLSLELEWTEEFPYVPEI